MRRFFEKIGRDSRGVTTIEYGLIAGVMGMGVLVSLNYVADELTAMVQPKGCTWDVIDVTEEDTSVACIGSPSWSPRRAQDPDATRTASSTN